MSERGRPAVRVRNDLRVGDLGRIIELHGEVYDREADGYGLRFEAFVARTVADFVLDNESRGRVWLAETGSALVACCAIAIRSADRAQLRWVLARPDMRGRGLGRRLVAEAIWYCRESGIETVYLETTDGLEASRKLYESLGFTEVARSHELLWDGVRPLIRMELAL